MRCMQSNLIGVSMHSKDYGLLRVIVALLVAVSAAAQGEGRECCQIQAGSGRLT
jgi:hypothetical protein